ncbi:MAG: hypothetical protein P1U85_19195 [Verrucomicrobiales bacterium]|jgi:hypothetical protein|nr:hypothetical protein [Verrucomicrobiales bacterium]
MKLTKAKILEIRKKAEFENAERVADQANNGRSAPFVNHNRAGLKEIRIEDVTGSVKWSYGKVTEKARRPRIEAKESRSIGPDHWRCHQDGFTIGTEPTDRGVNGEANQQVLWRLEKVERLAAVTGRRLTPERLLEQCKVQAANGVLNYQDLVKLSKLCVRLGGPEIGPRFANQIREIPCR